MSDVATGVQNGLLLVGGASLGYALHSTISTGEFSPLFVTGLGTLAVWLAIRGNGDETADGSAVGGGRMTDWQSVGWVLLTLGLVNSVWGAYELGAGGENSFLLLSGLGCLTIWLVLQDELVADAESDVEQEGHA